jgi:hypothetical protein
MESKRLCRTDKPPNVISHLLLADELIWWTEMWGERQRPNDVWSDQGFPLFMALHERFELLAEALDKPSSRWPRRRISSVYSVKRVRAALAKGTHEKERAASQDMRPLPIALHLAKEVGPLLGRGALLLRAVPANGEEPALTGSG